MSDYRIARRRPSRARETAAVYRPPSSPEDAPPRPAGFIVAVAERGRIVLPAEVRDRLAIKDGDWLTLVVEPDGVIRLLTGAVYARRLRGMFKHVAPGRRLVDELIAERRREAAAEERALRKTGALAGKKKRG